MIPLRTYTYVVALQIRHNKLNINLCTSHGDVQHHNISYHIFATTTSQSVMMNCLHSGTLLRAGTSTWQSGGDLDLSSSAPVGLFDPLQPSTPCKRVPRDPQSSTLQISFLHSAHSRGPGVHELIAIRIDRHSQRPSRHSGCLAVHDIQQHPAISYIVVPLFPPLPPPLPARPIRQISITP